MKKYLDRIAAACGVPDPAFGCRLILGIVEEARKKSEAYQRIIEGIEALESYKAKVTLSSDGTCCALPANAIWHLYDEVLKLKEVDCPHIIPIKE